MSKIARQVNNQRALENESNRLHLKEAVINFDGGVSYKLNPIETLKIVSTSSIFGEPAYYREGGLPSKRDTKGIFGVTAYSGYGMVFLDDVVEQTLFGSSICEVENTAKLMEKIIDDALEYDFEETLKFACELRHDYFMRLNPQVIMVRAAMHPARKKFTSTHPAGAFREYEKKVMYRADDPLCQMAYYNYIAGGKSKMPSVLKRSCADKLSSLEAYQLNKYKNAEIGMIDGIRLCHASSPEINQLMHGELVVADNEQTWEKLRVAGETWHTILSSIRLGHMALLRNLRGIAMEFKSTAEDLRLLSNVLNHLKSGVANGKQFPYRYYSAYKAIDGCASIDGAIKTLMKDALHECMMLSIKAMPTIPGNVVCCSDNSGSAWGAFTSEYGSMTVAIIGNLSSLITAMLGDYGEVVVFGDTYATYHVSKTRNIFEQLEEINELGKTVGSGTEGGLWEFMCEAILGSKHIDSLFVYSDQQAGFGGLYTSENSNRYKEFSKYLSKGYNKYFNFFAICNAYREKVNKKLNMFSIQTAGYDNMIVPAMAYRTAILSGWTGKEALFAYNYTKQWNEVDSKAPK